jgi:hypothetical protein
MPKVFEWNGYRFYFFSNEGYPREPVHVHVEKDDMDAKFWLLPDVQVAYNCGFKAKTLRELQRIAEERRDEIVEAWNEFFG